jgi:hypothetical protein
VKTDNHEYIKPNLAIGELDTNGNSKILGVIDYKEQHVVRDC